MKKNIASVRAEATGSPQAQIVADTTNRLTPTAEEAKEHGLVHELKTP